MGSSSRLGYKTRAVHCYKWEGVVAGLTGKGGSHSMALSHFAASEQ